jgi:hypothetical protein
MYTAAVFLGIEKAFDTTWHYSLLNKLLLTSVIKLFSPFPSRRQFRVSVTGEMSTPRDMQAEVP